jgi:hypothetical protein
VAYRFLEAEVKGSQASDLGYMSLNCRGQKESAIETAVRLDR